MKIRCWGARGSIPVSGPEYDGHGGDTPCLEIRSGNDEVLIVDCGTGIRRLGNRLFAEKRKKFHIVFTHAHWDHIIGFPFFRPLYVPGTTIDFYGCPFAQKSIRTILSKTMEPPFFPVNLDEVAATFTFNDACIAPFTIDTVLVEPILLSHPNQGVGYRFVESGRTFVFLTDNELDYRHPGGLDYDDYRDFAAAADLLVHDAEYGEEEYVRKRGWGHTPYRRALELALDAGVKRFGLFHHNQERTDADLHRMVDDCRRIIAGRGRDLECFAMTQDTELEV